MKGVTADDADLTPIPNKHLRESASSVVHASLSVALSGLSFRMYDHASFYTLFGLELQATVRRQLPRRCGWPSPSQTV